jgi:tetratricopeptide (TPR) repeat protein/tRNA A-37 threonylcarbamoyl transferase component Bud32
MNCPSCGGLATVSNERCTACGVATRTDKADHVWTRALDAAAAKAAGLGSNHAFEGTASPPDAATGPGLFADAPTGAGTAAADSATQAALDADADATRPGTPTEAGLSRDDSPSGPLSPGHSFGPRYHIVRLLGIGGMGAVYQAWDAELGVVVAVKVIRPEVAADPLAAAMLERRFKQELLLARQVTHKNVVRIYDLGEIDGIKFITMPFIEGDELATIIRSQDKLPIERVMKIARGIARGLEAAHAAGVVHRDLKPANIMVDASDEAMIMDFGIARSTGGPNAAVSDVAAAFKHPAGALGQTMAGAVVGTVQYMAPEQARAEPVDQRADIYAFGLIVYDMLLNQQRARGADTAIAELTRRMQSPPPAPRSINPGIPEPLDRLVSQCVKPNAAERFQTTPQLVAALNRLDNRGQLLPVVRRVTRRLAAAVLGVFVALLGLTWWLAQGPPVPVAHEPVSVLIADFHNGTGDQTFDRTLEPILKLALEGAGFISAYDRNGIRRSLGVRPPETLDEQAALALAVKQGVNVVLSGSVERQSSRYVVSVKAVQAVTGNVIAAATNRASSKDQVLGVATALADDVREALGDDTSDSAQRFAMETLTATSLDAVREYARGMEAMSGSKFDDALQSFSKAVALDPKFGVAYGAMAATSANLDRLQDAEKYAQEAMRLVDSMTERERYRVRGFYYSITNDYLACVKEYGDLITRFAADAAARNNRALCLTQLRKMPEAVDEMRQAVKILPNRALYRQNLAQYANYSGDFQTAEQEVLAMPDPGLFALLALAFAQVGQGQVAEATKTYEGLGKIGPEGTSFTASGLADLAIYQGRYSDAERILAQGADADLAAGIADKAARKFATIAEVQLLRQQKAAATAAAEKALSNSQAIKIRFLAARVFLEAGAAVRAKTLAAGLAAELQAEPQAYASIIEGLTALNAGDARQAIKLFTAANEIFDTWIGHFYLGRAYLNAGAFPQADSEFDRCLKRRGEALSFFLDEEPTYGYFPPVYYYQGRVRDGLKSTNSGESYRAYLDIRGNSREDPFVAEVRRRAAAGEPR